MNLCLALLSGGSAVGQNVLFSLAAWRHRLRVVATTSVADEPALFAFDSVYLVPPTADGAGFDRCIVELIAAQSPDLVIPCRDDDVRYLGALADRDDALAPRLMCGNAASAEIVSDKVRGHAFCVANGLPFVPSLSRETIATRDTFVREQGFPLLAKPRRGWASRDVRLLWTEAQVDRALARDDCVVQRFLGARTALQEYFASIEADGVPLLKSFMGEKHSIQMLVGPRGDVREVMAIRVRKDLRSRSVVPDTTPSTLALGRRCAEALSRAGWRGPLNIQCGKDADGTLWIHEFNGRFTGVTADRALLGHNEVVAGVTAFTGFAFEGVSPAPATMSISSLVTRAADPQAVRTLASEGFWQRRT